MVNTVESYIRRIRNTTKKAYAVAFWNWLQSGEQGLEPSRSGLSCMAAQAVRNNLYDFKVSQ